MGALLSKAKTALKLYLLFALAHTSGKLLKLFYRLYKKNTVWAHIPGYPMDPLAKNVSANKHRLHDFRADRVFGRPEGDFIKVGDQNLVCTSKESVEWMLKLDFDKITKPNASEDIFFYTMRDFIGRNGIFLLRHGKTGTVSKENDMWYHQRKTASLIFTKNKFKSQMYETFIEKCNIFLRVCGKYADKGEIIDIQEKCFAFTMDSIQNIFFGRKVDTLEKEDVDPFGHAFDEAHHCMMSFLYKNIPLMLLAKGIMPFPFGTWGGNNNSSLLINYKWNFSQDSEAFRQHVKTLHGFSEDIIAAARKDKNLENRRDMLALFLQSKAKFSDVELRDIILNMTIAGRDTTACTLTWTIFLLTQHPEIEAELCREIDEVIKGEYPTFEDVTPEKMPYLNGVLYESLRLYPPVPNDGKEVLEETTYLDGTKIPVGAKLLFQPYTMGRSKRFYDDPMKVDPHRWIPFETPNPFAFPVFQAGPRFCLGKDMAQFEAKIVIASLYKNFTFKLLEGELENITYSNSITMNLCNSKTQDSYNLWVTPQRRKS